MKFPKTPSFSLSGQRAPWLRGHHQGIGLAAPLHWPSMGLR